MKSFKYAVKLMSKGEIYTVFVYAACIGNAKCAAIGQVGDDDAIILTVFPVKG
jgi:hypothetical protein